MFIKKLKNGPLIPYSERLISSDTKYCVHNYNKVLKLFKMRYLCMLSFQYIKMINDCIKSSKRQIKYVFHFSQYKEYTWWQRIIHALPPRGVIS